MIDKQKSTIMQRLKNKSETVMLSLRRRVNRRRMKNSDITIISCDCTGGQILHDLGLRFNTPTVNLFFEPKDFIKLCNNTQKYLLNDIIFINVPKIEYPVGLLDDIKFISCIIKQRMKQNHAGSAELSA